MGIEFMYSGPIKFNAKYNYNSCVQRSVVYISYYTLRFWWWWWWWWC